jgi:hypothetical protein
MPRRLFAAILTMCVLSLIARATDDLQIGTWKLNLEKSKYSPGFPAPKSQTFKCELADSVGIKFIQDGMDDLGNPVHVEYVVKFDDKDYPVKGDPSRDTVVLKRIDAYRTEGVSKKAGKIVGIFNRAVSGHGKVLTIKSNGTRDGRRYNNVAIYDRQ